MLGRHGRRDDRRAGACKITQEAIAYRPVAFATYCTLLVLAGASVNVLGPAGPSLAANLQLNPAHMGLVFTAEGIGNTAGAAVIDRLIDRYKPHAIISALTFTTGAALALVPVCSSIHLIFFLYVAVGFSNGCMGAIANVLTSWAMRGPMLGMWINVLSVCTGIGASGAPIVFLFSERHAYSGLDAFLAFALFAMLPTATAWLTQSPQPSPKTSSREEHSETSPLIDPSSAGGDDDRSTPAAEHSLLGSTHVKRFVIMPMLIVSFLGISAELAYSAWLYPFAIERTGMESHGAALLVSLFWSAFTCGRVCLVPLAAMLPPQALLLPTLSMLVAANVLVLAYPTSASMLWLGTAGAGAGVCALFSNSISLMAHYNLLSTRITGALHAAAAGGHMLGPSVCGYLMHHTSTGHDMLPLFCLICNTASLLIVVLVVIYLHLNFTPVTAFNLRPLFGLKREKSGHATSEVQPTVRASIGVSPMKRPTTYDYS